MKNILSICAVVLSSTMLLAGCSAISNPLLDKTDQNLDGAMIDQLEEELNQELVLDGENDSTIAPAISPTVAGTESTPAPDRSTPSSSGTDYKSLELEAGAIVLEGEPLD